MRNLPSYDQFRLTEAASWRGNFREMRFGPGSGNATLDAKAKRLYLRSQFSVDSEKVIVSKFDVSTTEEAEKIITDLQKQSRRTDRGLLDIAMESGRWEKSTGKEMWAVTESSSPAGGPGDSWENDLQREFYDDVLNAYYEGSLAKMKTAMAAFNKKHGTKLRTPTEKEMEELEAFDAPLSGVKTPKDLERVWHKLMGHNESLDEAVNTKEYSAYCTGLAVGDRFQMAGKTDELRGNKVYTVKSVNHYGPAMAVTTTGGEYVYLVHSAYLMKVLPRVNESVSEGKVDYSETYFKMDKFMGDDQEEMRDFPIYCQRFFLDDPELGTAAELHLPLK